MRRKILQLSSIFLLTAGIFYSCRKTEAPVSQEVNSSANKIVPKEIVEKLTKAGFDTSQGLRVFQDGYIVENDIYLTETQIDELLSDDYKKKGNSVNHYRTNNLVSGVRQINVYMDPAFGTYMQSAFNSALARFNAVNLKLTFKKATSSTTADIRINAFYEVSSTLGVAAGFPTGGNPGNTISLNTYYYNNSSQRADATTVIAHEIGHAIGFRHTDYMNRTFSCGTGGDEGQGTVGAVHIPGTPTAPAANSWMLACSNGFDRPFTKDDITSLATVYPHQYADGSMYRESSDINVYVIFGGAKLKISSADEVVDLYGGWANVQIVPDGTLANVSTTPRTGYMLRENNHNEVYYIENGIKRWIQSSDTVVALGGWWLVKIVPDNSLSHLPTGTPIP